MIEETVFLSVLFYYCTFSYAHEFQDRRVSRSIYSRGA